jgi:hypothetical protein
MMLEWVHFSIMLLYKSSAAWIFLKKPGKESVAVSAPGGIFHCKTNPDLIGMTTSKKENGKTTKSAEQCKSCC